MAQFRKTLKGEDGKSSSIFNSRISGPGPGFVNSQVPSNQNDNLISSNAGMVTYAQKEQDERERIARVEELPELHIISSVISVYSEEEIKRISVVDIVNPDISSPRFHTAKSLYDTCMGTIVSNRMCGTCQIVNCLGHFGRIPISSPLPHPMWLGVIKDILTSVCRSCGALLVDSDFIDRKGLKYMSAQKRISEIAKVAVSRKECPNIQRCPDIRSGNLSECQPNLPLKAPKSDESFEISEMLKIGDSAPKAVPIPVEKILTILKCISDKDAKLMGFTGDSRPENLIIQSLLVIPPVSRPPFIADNRNNPDDLTEAYRQIVICANELRLLNSSDTDFERVKTNLYFKIKVLMEGKKQKYKNVKKFMSITNRLQGKQAVPRASLMGKRTNMCARTVISPDTSLTFGQIRIPMEWSSLLTLEEKVTATNIDAVRNLLAQGKITDVQTYHDGKGSQRKGATKDTVLSIGDSYRRNMRDGDIVVVNRQPTLHKFSMMAFEAKLGKERSAGLHLSYTTPFNADFDGDEMNIWVPQSLEARAEARELLHVTKNIMSPAKNKVNMGLVYDAITASHVLIRQNQIDEGLYYELKGVVENSDDLVSLDQRLLKHKVPPRSGRGVFSMLLPATLNYFKGDVVILDGVLISGAITGEHVGPSSKSIVETIYMEFGEERYSEFITYASFLVLKFITEHGHTVGIDDCMAIDKDRRMQEKMENEKAFEIIQAKIDALDPPRDDDETSLQLYESKIEDILMSSFEMGFSLIKQNVGDPENNIGAMLKGIGGGAKGKLFNIQQIRGRLGQQYRKGKRLPLSCNGRILPGFDENDPDIRARGYIKSNFMRGLSPEEHFLHMMAAREGLIDTAVNVAVMGDIHRRIVKALENIYVNETGAVVNSSKANFQLLLGADGFDPARLITVKRAGSDGDPIASFIDLREKAKFLNKQAGWISKKTSKLTSYNNYIIDSGFDLYKDENKIDVTDKSINFDLSDLTKSIYDYLYIVRSDQLLQEVVAYSKREEGSKDSIRLRFYYKLSEGEDGEKFEDRQGRFEAESTYQLNLFKESASSVFLLRRENPEVVLVLKDPELI